MKGWFFLWILSVWRKRMKGLNKKNKLSKHNKTLWDDNTKKGIRRGVCLMEERIQKTGDSHFWTRWRRCILHLRKASFKRTRCRAHTSYWLIITHQALPVALTSTSHDYVPPLGTEESLQLVLSMLKLNLIKCFPLQVTMPSWLYLQETDVSFNIVTVTYRTFKNRSVLDTFTQEATCQNWLLYEAILTALQIF